MLNRIGLAAAAALAIGVLAAPQTASAGWRHPGWHGGGGWHGGPGWNGGWRHRHWGGGHWGHRHWGWRPAYPRYGVYGGGYGAWAGCIRWRQVPTPWGFQWRRVNICF